MSAAEQTPAQRVVTLTPADFDQRVSGSQPILVDFWVRGCGPCAAPAPILDEFAREHAGKLRVGKLRLDQAPDLVQRFALTTLPTLIVFADGQPKTRITGVDSTHQLLRQLDRFLP